MASRRRGRGEGSFKRLKTGKWIYRLRSGDVERTATGATQQEARRNLLDKLAKEQRPKPGESFGSLARRLSQSAEWGQTTKDNFAAWLSSRVDGTPIADMKGADDAMIAQWLKAQGGAPATKRGSFARLKAVLKFAGLSTTVKPPKKAQGRRRPLTPEERASLEALARSAGPRQHLAFLLAVESGLRRGEICGLAYEDFDGEGFWVRRSVVATKGGVRVKGVKNDKWRWVAVPPSVAESVGSGSGFVLGEGKKPLNPKTLASWFYDLKQGSGIDVPYLGLHALRRTYGMTLLEAGTDVKTAAELMGHDEAMLLKVYSGSRRDLKIEAVRKAFGGTSRGTEKPKGA